MSAEDADALVAAVEAMKDLGATPYDVQSGPLCKAGVRFDSKWYPCGNRVSERDGYLCEGPCIPLVVDLVDPKESAKMK